MAAWPRGGEWMGTPPPVGAMWTATRGPVAFYRLRSVPPAGSCRARLVLRTQGPETCALRTGPGRL